MVNKKYYCKSIIAMFLIVNCLGCSKMDSSIIESYSYDEYDIIVKKEDVLSEKQITYYEWIDINEIDFENECDLIAKGTIKNAQEISMNYKYMGADVIDYGTIWTVSLDEIYMQEGNEKTEVLVYFPLSTHDYAEEIGIPEIGSVYYFFLEKVVGSEKNSLGYEKIVDYFMVFPPNYLLSDQSPTEKQNDIIKLYEKNSPSKVVQIQEELLLEQNEGNIGDFLSEFYKK